MEVWNAFYEQICSKKNCIEKELDIYNRLLKLIHELKVNVEDILNLSKDLEKIGEGDETSTIESSDDEISTTKEYY